MNKDCKKLVAIYCRVSTQEQAEEGYSIGEQERLLREYYKEKGYEVKDVFTDAGISGKDIQHRPAIQQLLKEATEKKFDLVMSWKINRLSRKLADAIKIIDTLEKYGITYKSYSEPFETDTPAGKMQFQMMALVGEFERNTIAQNVKMGMIAKARSGEWCGGVAPLGYQWIPMEGTEHLTRKKSRLEIEEQEAETVRLIFELYASGKGYKAIVNRLNTEGFNVRRDWNEKRRHNINPNPVIVDGIHEAIIEEELFHQVQFMISQKAGKPSRIYDGEYPLTGILKCPICGAGMVMSRVTATRKDGSKNRMVYYCCGNWKNKGTAVCHSNMIRVEKANDFVYQRLEEIMTDDKFFHEVVSRVNREHEILKTNACKERTIQEREADKIRKRQKKNYESYEDGLNSKEEFLERKNELNEQLEQVKQRTNETALTLITEKKKEIPTDTIRSILQDFGKILSSDIDRTVQKRLLHMLISEITIDKGRNIDSIKLKLSDELIRFLQNNGGTPTDTDGVPSVFIFRELGIKTLELELVI